MTEAQSEADFYPRSPCGERLPLLVIRWLILLFLSTLSLRRATDINRGSNHVKRHISIHALLAESDYDTSSLTKCQVKFLSTLSLRRATGSGLAWLAPRAYFYPRSPCGERLHYDNYNLHCVEISIHALLAESDCLYPARCVGLLYFYPRSPCGERQSLRSAY